MKYCQYCGRAMQDPEVCNCRAKAPQAKNQKDDNEIFFGKPTPSAELPQGRIYPNEDIPEGMGKCIFTAVVYPLLMSITAIAVCVNGLLSILGAVLIVALSAAAAACILYGGFYLIIIPLPIIFLFKSGCVKPYLQMGKRLLLGFAPFLLFLACIACFVFL